MRIRYLVSMAGERESHAPGDIGEVSAEAGKRLIAVGFAEQLAKRKVSKAIGTKHERATEVG